MANGKVDLYFVTCGNVSTIFTALDSDAAYSLAYGHYVKLLYEDKLPTMGAVLNKKLVWSYTAG